MNFQDLDIKKVGNTIQLVGCMYAGEGKNILCFFPSENDNFPTETLEMNSAEWQEFFQQTDLINTEIIARDKNGDLKKIAFRKSQRQIDAHLTWNCFRRDKYACQYCGADNVPLTIDHLVLWEEGGPTTMENLLSACKRCNKTRGNTQYEQWLESPYYQNVSHGLTESQRQRNKDLVKKLGTINRVYVRSR